jgi:radical SAM superfamily enzyme YgiQ (UPF0313 family)
MKASITFIPECKLNSDSKVSRQPLQAIYLLGELLIRWGIETEIIDQSEIIDIDFDDFEQLENKLIRKADILLFSANSFNWGNTRNVIATIKKHRPELPVVLGGIHATMLDTYVASSTRINVVMRGEGERNIVQVCYALAERDYRALSMIKSITYRNEHGEMVRNEDDSPLTDEEYNEYNNFSPFNKLPLMVYDAIPCETSRGCMYNCSFCGVGIHRSWKTLTIENLYKKIDETVEYVRTKTRSNLMMLTDDCFTSNRERMFAVLDHINGLSYKPMMVLEGRLNEIQSPEVLSVIRDSNIQRFLVGIECGYDEGLKKVRKGYNTEMIERYLAMVKAAGVSEKIYCSFIICFPWETAEHCIQTIKFAARLVEKYGVRSNISTWSIIPSELWDRRREYGIEVEESMFDNPTWFDTNKDIDFFYKTHPNLSREGNRRLSKVIGMYYNRGIKLMDNYLKE